MKHLGHGTGPAVFLLLLLFAALLGAGALSDPSGRALGNLRHAGPRGEFFHITDIAHNAAEGRLATCFESRRLALPEGQDLREFMGFSLHLFFYLPLLWLRNVVTIYNVFLVLTMALNGFCAYLFARQLTGRLWPSVLGGALFMISPFALLKIEMGFVQKALLWWIPLFLRDVLRYLDRPAPRRAALAGAVWALMLLTYAPYAWYALWALAILGGTRFVMEPDQRRALLPRAWPFALPALAAFVVLLISLPGGGVPPKEPGAADLPPLAVAMAPNGCLDLLRLFRFAPYPDFMPRTAYLRLGISLVGFFLSAVAVVHAPRKALPLAIVADFFLLVAIGPFFHTGGRILSRFPLPSYFFACCLPWGERLGFPIRALPFVEIALAGLTALIVARWSTTPRRRLAVPAGVLALVLCERALLLPELFPPGASDAALPPHLRWLRAEGGTVLHLPFNVRGNDVRHYLYVTARTNTRMLNRYLGFWSEYPVPPLPADEPEDVRDYVAMLIEDGCDLIVIHPRLLAADIHPMLVPPEIPIETYDLADTRAFEPWCGPPVFSNAALIAYHVPNALPAEAAALTPDIPERALRAWYNAHPDRFRRPRTLRLHHFFVRRAASNRQARAAEIAATLAQGDAATLALSRELSAADPQGRRWGDLGFVARGCLPPDVEEAVFAGDAVGEVVTVERDDGTHIFRIMDIRPARQYPFEEVRVAVADAVRAERRPPRPAPHPAAPLTNDMVRIEGGTFRMGSTEAEMQAAFEMARRFAGRTCEVRRAWFEDEIPRTVTVGPFLMDRREVTLDQYRAFLDATGYPPLPDWVHRMAAQPDMPVVGVSLEDARAYAGWAGKRLPTVEEWAWAARGAERRLYPWGDEPPDGTRANYADAGTGFAWRDLDHNDGYAGLAPVGSYPAGATPSGLLDLAGNAREWTGTPRWGVTDTRTGHIWSLAQQDQVPARLRSAPEIMYAVRGGAWNNAADDMRCSDERMLPPDTRHEALGFRCVLGLPENMPLESVKGALGTP